MKVSICHSQIKNSSSDIQLCNYSSIKENWIHGLVFIFKKYLNFRNCVCVRARRVQKSALILHSILDWRNGAMIIFIYPGIFLVMNLGNFSFLTCFWKSPKCTQFTSWVDISTFVWCMGFKIVLYVHNNAILIADPPLRFQPSPIYRLVSPFLNWLHGRKRAF